TKTQSLCALCVFVVLLKSGILEGFFMPNIKERILKDAGSRKERYADRMEVVEIPPDNLPAGLTLYSVNISQLFDYIPINYIVTGDEFYTSLQKGDFSRLLKRIKFLEEK